MSKPSKSKEISQSVLKYCPDYKSFDVRARLEAHKRFAEHVTERKNLVVKCIDSPIAEINNLGLSLTHIPSFIDDDGIINDSLTAINDALQKWNGVQISKQFIAEYNKTGNVMDWKKFGTVAKNHQDQTSWKVSGDHFFAPYIKRCGQYLYDYCQCIAGIDDALRDDIYLLSGICYIVQLLEYKIKFHRTKPKPLLRYKTLANSPGVHYELEALFPELKVRKFIETAKRKRRQKCGKSNIIAEEFYQNLLSCSKNLYRQQKMRVYDALQLELANDDDININDNGIEPSDLLDSDAENDTNTYSSVSSYTNNRDRVRSNHNYDGQPREFQSVPQFGVRERIRSERKRKRSHDINENLRRMHRDQDNDDNDDDEDEDFDMNDTELPSTTNSNSNSNSSQQPQHSLSALEEEQKISALEQENEALRAQLQNMLQQLRNIPMNQLHDVLPPPVVPPYHRHHTQQIAPRPHYHHHQQQQQQQQQRIGYNDNLYHSSLSLPEFDNLNALNILNNQPMNLLQSMSSPYIDNGELGNFDEFQIPAIPSIPNEGILRVSSTELLSGNNPYGQM